MFKYYIYKFGQFIVNHLSLKAAYSIASFVSDLHYWFSFRDRRAVKNNLRVILRSDNNIPFLTRQVFRSFGLYLVEFFRTIRRVDEDFISRCVRIHNQHYADQIVKLGKGGIVLTAHIGNWELGGVLFSVLGYPIDAIALPHKERPVNDLFNHQRQVKGVRVIPANIAVRRCLESLRENRFVALVADRDFNFNGEIMDFLGKKVLIPKGAAVLSRKMGSPILPTFLIRQDDFTFDFSFESPLYPNYQLGEEEDILRIMGQYKTLIEQKVRLHPTQWLMFRKFWV